MPFLIYPTAGGDAEEIERFLVIDTLSEYLARRYDQRSHLPGFDLEGDLTFYFLCLPLLLGYLYLCRRIVASPFGRVIRAAKQNEANKKIVTDIVLERSSKFLATDFII